MDTNRCSSNRLTNQIFFLLFFLILEIIFCIENSSIIAITLEEERLAGQEIFKKIFTQVKFIDDQTSIGYLQTLGTRLATKIKDNPFVYHFYITDSSEINAFAIPGAYIILNRGMINALENEAELAGVLAHEISHVDLRHITTRIKKKNPLNTAMIFGTILGTTIASSSIGILGPALIIKSMASEIQDLAFSREDEAQADYNGYQIITRLGYSGTDMAKSLKYIWKQELLFGLKIPYYLRSHPSNIERIERIEDIVQRNPQILYPYDNQKFLRIRMRLNALYEPLDKTIRHLELIHTENPHKALPIYGLALTYIRLGYYNLALAYLDLLNQLWPNNPLIWREQAKCYFFLNEYNKAQQLYNRSIAWNPQDQEALSGLAQTFLHLKKLESAQLTFKQMLTINPDNDQTLYELGIVLAKQGYISEGSLYLGQAFLRRGNEENARYHLSQAIQGLTDQPELAKLAYLELELLEKKTNKNKTQN